MNEIVLFGNSPFINHVAVNTLICRYHAMACNSFGASYCVDYLFLYDSLVQPKSDATLTFVPNWFNKAPKGFIKYRAINNHRPLLHSIKSSGCPVYGRRHFTSSIAINWAILNGFKKIYLVGIDHIETDKSLKHFDDTPSHSKITPIMHREFKEFVYNATKFVKIYQTNPQVKADWRLPFKRLEDLYLEKSK